MQMAALQQQPSTSQDQPWFAALRSKISAAFSTSDWFRQLGVEGEMRARSQENLNQDYAQAVSSLSQRSAQRAQSEQPRTTNSSNANENFAYMRDTLERLSLQAQATSSSESSQAEQWTSFWDNLQPGRNYHDTLELQHFGPLTGLSTMGKQQLGKGHDFQSTMLLQPTWCDKCGDFIWGFVRQAMRCSKCQYTCHYRCRALVTLDCRSIMDIDNWDMDSSVTDYSTWHTARSEKFAIYAKSKQGTDVPTNDALTSPDVNSDDEWFDDDDELIKQQLQGDMLRRSIEKYNNKVPPECRITLHDNGFTYSGYVHVHMNFSRPISVIASQQTQVVYDVIPNDNAGNTMYATARSIASFYLPRGTVKTLHIDSETCTREMIVTLLKKFHVADNPRKFALYERQVRRSELSNGETLCRAKLNRISDDAYPLKIALQWALTETPDIMRRFVLQENDTGDILWDAFEIPELENFLLILKIEEQQHLAAIKQRYEQHRLYLRAEMVNRGMPIMPLEEKREEEEGSKTPQHQKSPARRVERPTTLSTNSSTMDLPRKVPNKPEDNDKTL